MEMLVLVGTPDTGKTNYLARLWSTLSSRKGRLICPRPPEDIKYVEDALGHILQGKFAPRSNKNIGESRSDVLIPIAVSGGDGAESELLIPDVTGELWRTAVEDLEIPSSWMDDLRAASGAVLFLRVLSDEIVAPLDWVISRNVLRNKKAIPKEQAGVPTQVQLCELLRFLELTLSNRADGRPPRVAVVVTAFDLLDRKAIERGPDDYLGKEYPLFAGRLKDETRLETKVFGVSVVSGDLDRDSEFRDQFLDGDLSMFGYVMVKDGDKVETVSDLSVPVAWIVEGK